ncbi:Colicin V synthesis protein [Burkholderiales bacterium 8X]|nr:Colicin V synthesis protein [Burkholderiales bacterium 8X]
MAVLDWIVLALVAVSMMVGLWRGLVFEVISLAGWVAAFFCAQWFAEEVGRWLPFGDPAGTWRYPAGFVLVFLVVVFGVGLVAALARRLFAAVGLRPIDRVMGGLFGLARAAVALLVLAAAVHLLALKDGAWWRESRTALVLDAALQGIKPALPEKLASYLP